ncbi:MAG: hypothetical protein ABIP16_07095 [Thermomonas sp.]
MEFHVNGLPGAVDMAVITGAINNIDPAAQVDIDPATGALRVNGSMSADELTTAIGSTGQDAAGLLVMKMPSHCCGGCGG